MRELTEIEKIEYNRLVEQAEQIELQIDSLIYKTKKYGYLRVSSKGQLDGNSLEYQEQALKAAGAEILFTDVYTGTTTCRPQLDELLSILKRGDTIIVTKLDRIARTVRQGLELIDNLVEKGVTVHVINLGTLDSTPTGKLIRTVLLAIAEFERDMIMERTQEGRAIARLKPDYHEGRKPKYSSAQINHAIHLLESYSYTQVSKMTGMSKSTLIRAVKSSKNNIII